MDFAKAFDKVSHKRTIYKLYYYDISNQIEYNLSLFDKFVMAWYKFTDGGDLCITWSALSKPML
jgi:hypothetical protein